MPISEISSALTAFNAAKEMIKIAFNAKLDAERQEARIEAMTLLGRAQDVLFELRDELSRLQAENEDLKEAAKAAADKGLAAQEYSIFQGEGGGIVYRFNGEPERFACPNCWNERISILQPYGMWTGSRKCPACNVSFNVKKDDPLPSLAVRNRT